MARIRVTIDNLWNEIFPGRDRLMRLRNQILYTVCSESPNSNVVIGREKYLFTPTYIGYETQILSPASEEYFQQLGEKLEKLGEMLEANGKEMYIFITPSKAHFCYDKIPMLYKMVEKLEGRVESNYDKLVWELNKRDLHYFDAISYIENNNEKYDAPVFYKSGIHWSHVWGESAAAELIRYMDQVGKYDLSQFCVTEKLTNECIWPNSDLHDSLNLSVPSVEEWYSTEITVMKEGGDKPSVFLRGGSCMGQSLNMLINNYAFSEDVHFENSYYFTNVYSDHKDITNFRAYDEMNLNELVGQSDILILEVNNAAISDMSWGFIDYLLEHTEYLDDVY